MRDLVSNIRVVPAVAPAVLTATTPSSAIDLQGAGSAAVLINTGAIVGSGKFAPSLQESTDNSTWSDVAADDILGTLPAELAASSAYKVGYRGTKRYFRVVLTLVSGTSIAASVVVALGDLDSTSA